MARATHVRKVYVKGDETKRSAFEGWEVLRFEMLAPEKDAEGNPVVIDTFDVSRGEVPQSIADCAFGHGISQKLGDNLAGIDKKVSAEGSELPGYDAQRGYANAIRALLEDQMEDLRNGIWVSEAEGGAGGGNVTILLEAVKAAFAKGGTELSDEQIAAFKTALADKEQAKAVKSNPAIAAEIARINKERADARAKEAAKRAKDAGAGGLADLLGGMTA